MTGGLVTTVWGVRVSARSPIPAALLALATFALWIARARSPRAMAADLADLDKRIVSHPRIVVGALALAAVAASIAFNSYSATGADASGYLSHSAMLLRGQLTYTEPLAPIAKWVDGEATLAPLGWRAVGDGAQVPTYAVGLPLLLAPWHALGGARAASFVVPLTFGIAVIVAAAIANRIGGPRAAMLAAVAMATNPVALVESMQVMSDVPVTAAWLACWWLLFEKRALPAGLMAAIAVLIRPNLAPVVSIPAIYALVSSRRDAAVFSLPVAIAAVFVGYLQWLWFGSPFRSGYGSATEIYSLSNVVPNAWLYAKWLVETNGVWLLVAPVALVVARDWRRLAWLFAFAAAVTGAYLAYAQFEVWTYLRFLLPVLAVAMIAVATLAAALVERSSTVIRLPLLIAGMLAVAGSSIVSARAHDVFRFAERNVRAKTVGERLEALLPVNAAIVSGEQSGSMRYYTGRSIVRWDLMDDAAMRDAVDWLTLNGYQVWVVLDDWEDEPFRKRVPSLASQTLDYEPSLESAAGVGIRTRAWRARRFIAKSSNNE